MTWQPLTQTYCAESYEGGIHIAHTFDSTDAKTAEAFAKSRGWTIVGVLVDEVEVEDEMVAQIEKTVKDPSLH